MAISTIPFKINDPVYNISIRVTLFYKKSKAKMGNVIFPFLRP